MQPYGDLAACDRTPNVETWSNTCRDRRMHGATGLAILNESAIASFSLRSEQLRRLKRPIGPYPSWSASVHHDGVWCPCAA